MVHTFGCFSILLEKTKNCNNTEFRLMEGKGMKTDSNPSTSTLSSPWLYFGLTLAWTWFFWILAAALNVGMESTAGFILLFLGILGPMVTGIGFTYLTQDKDGRRDYWTRVRDFRRISAKWYLVIFLFVPMLNVLAAALDVLMGGSGATVGEAATNFLSQPLSIVPSILFASLIPFIEELGWRGYVLDRLQSRRTALLSSLILGTVWSLWHLPLFFIEGTYQHNLGVGSLAFWAFMIGVVPLSFSFTWIYNNTLRSTLAVILFHSMVNFTGELIAITERADAYSILLWIVVAVAITVFWGPKTFTRKDHRTMDPLRRRIPGFN
jgi:membrane protease YdiL (CAAX protease family)